MARAWRAHGGRVANMNRRDLTQGQENAMRRLSAGSEIDLNMWQELHRAGLVERRQGKRALTEKGRSALGLAGR